MPRPASAAPRAAACPGLLRVVAARDGGLCRVRLPGGELSAAQARAIADAAARFGSGAIEVTNRANLQLRGVRDESQQALVDTLLDAGLGPSTPGADDTRNLMTSPLAGLDHAAKNDVSTLAANLLAQMQRDTRLHALSPKFALLLDGGEPLAMLDHAHDIWLAAMDAEHFAFGLAGCPPVDAHDTPALAAVATRHVPALVHALLHTFLDLAAPDRSRMRDLLATLPPDAFISRLSNIPLLHDATVQAWRRPPADPSLRLGAHAQRAAGPMYVGAQPLLGRLDPASLRALAHLADQKGSARLRMTPWQSVLLPDIAAADASSTLATLRALGFAIAPDEPFARLIACAGSTGCAKGAADTKADALRLAARLPPSVQVHLSGCTRSCAAAHRVPFTLLAVAPGRYDLYQNADAARAEGFGVCVAHHLTIQEAADWLARSNPDA